MDRYVIEKTMGEGTYGIVYKALEKRSMQIVAIKQFKFTNDDQLSKRELQAVSMLTHPHIVTFRDSFRVENILHLVFDFVKYDLSKLMGKNPKGVDESRAKKIVYQLTKAIHCCHKNHFIHRDIKPENILLDEHEHVKLCDFGLARTISFMGSPLTDYVATRWYRPPEQELRCSNYSFSADIWSIGCILVELLTGQPLFPGNTQVEQIGLMQQLLGPLPSDLHSRIPAGVFLNSETSLGLRERFGGVIQPVALDFVEKVVRLDCKMRLTAAQCLEHPFFKDLREIDRKEEQIRIAEQLSSLHMKDGIEEDLDGVSEVEMEHNTPTLMLDESITEEVSDELSLSAQETIPSSPTNNVTEQTTGKIMTLIQSEPQLVLPIKDKKSRQQPHTNVLLSRENDYYEDDFHSEEDE